MTKNPVKNSKDTKKATLTTKATLKMEKLALENILEDIQKDREEAEVQRKAILNILEDVNLAQSELKKKYSELQTISELTHALGLSLETSSAMHSAGKAIINVIPSSITVFCLAPLDSDFAEEEFNIYSNQFITDSNLAYIASNVYNDLSKKCSRGFIKSPQESFKNLFLQGENKDSSNPISQEPIDDHISVPINISGKSVGLISIFAQGESKIQKNELSTLKTIISNLSQTIEKLRILVSSEYSRFSNLVDSMSNGVIMFDLSKRILLVNPRAQKVIGKEQNDISLDLFLSSIHGMKKDFDQSTGFKDRDTKYNINSVVDDVIKMNEPASFQDVTINERTYELFITPIRDFRREIAGGAIVMHDITYLKEINKLKSEFVSVASHQLRTPLTSIRLFTEMLLEGSVGNINNDQKEYIENMYKSTVGMIQLVNNLLNLSRIEAGKLEVSLKQVDMIDFTNNIIDEVGAIAGKKGVKISFKKPTKTIKKITTDPNLLKQVIHNLVVNAIRYSGLKKPEVKIKLDIKEGELSMDVSDYGIGIPKAMQDKVFSKFFRADNAVKVETEGNGLGLYIAKTIIEGLEGTISFKSKENKGTTFYVSLPVK